MEKINFRAVTVPDNWKAGGAPIVGRTGERCGCAIRAAERQVKGVCVLACFLDAIKVGITRCELEKALDGDFLV